jgi:hypothetical protein
VQKNIPFILIFLHFAKSGLQNQHEIQENICVFEKKAVPLPPK